MSKNPFRYFKTSPEIIQLAVMVLSGETGLEAGIPLL